MARYNFNDFDFNLPEVARSRVNKSSPFDIVARAFVKGKKRATSYYQVVLNGLERKLEGKSIDNFAFGVNKFKKKHVGLAVINSKIPTAVPCQKGEYRVLNNKGLTMRLANFAGVSLPEMPDTSMHVYFKCTPVEGQNGVFEVVAHHVNLFDKDDVMTRHDISSEAQANASGGSNSF